MLLRNLPLLHTSLALLTLCGSSSAQSLYYDGLLNSPLDRASLSLGDSGQLIVATPSTSGSDGIKVDLAGSQGGSISATTTLDPGEVATFIGEYSDPDTNQTYFTELTFTGDQPGSGLHVRPDYSQLGHQTYGLRCYLAGQVVFDQDGLGGSTRMHNNNTQQLPHYVYELPTYDQVLNGIYCLNCVTWGGGTVQPPGTATPIDVDLVEFYSPVGELVELESLRLTVMGPSSIEISGEQLRYFGHWVNGEGLAQINTQQGGLEITNLGSSGEDGVSIAVPAAEHELQGELGELVSTDNPGALITLESSLYIGEPEQVRIKETAGQWILTPDFSGRGAGSYSLELRLAGQVVFAQSGMRGAGVSTDVVSSFRRQEVMDPSGTNETEWILSTPTPSMHTTSGGHSLLADSITLRSEGAQTPGTSSAVTIRARDLSGDLLLEAFQSGSAPCLGSNYCVAAPNSVSPGATLCAAGSGSIAANDLVLQCSSLPTNQFGVFYYGPNQIQLAFGNGWRCVGGGVFRLPILNSGSGGVMTYVVDNTSPPQASGQLQAGESWNFQCWYRDPAGGGAAFNLSDATSILFTP